MAYTKTRINANISWVKVGSVNNWFREIVSFLQFERFLLFIFRSKIVIKNSISIKYSIFPFIQPYPLNWIVRLNAVIHRPRHLKMKPILVKAEQNYDIKMEIDLRCYNHPIHMKFPLWWQTVRFCLNWCRDANINI